MIQTGKINLEPLSVAEIYQHSPIGERIVRLLRRHRPGVLPEEHIPGLPLGTRGEVNGVCTTTSLKLATTKPQFSLRETETNSSKVCTNHMS